MEELETKEESDRDKRRARLRKKLETRKRKAEETQEKRNKKIKTIDKDDEAEEKEEVEEVEKEKAEDKEEAFYVIPKSEELLFVTHELLGQLESKEEQNVEEFELLAKRAFSLFKKDFGGYSQLNPSFHRALQHGAEFMAEYQTDGFTVGELSECAQEAINAPTKADVIRFSFQGSYKAQNLQTFERNSMFSDPKTLEFDV